MDQINDEFAPPWLVGLVVGWVVAAVACISLFTQWQYHRAGQQLEGTRDLETATLAVRESTGKVHESVQELATATARAQKLAVWIGVGTAVLGAILGAFAGAWAARLVGA